MTTVLLLENARSNGSSFAPHLEKRYDLIVATTGKAALALLQSENPDVFVLDAASMRTSGDRICQAVRSINEDLPIIHIKSEAEEDEENESVAHTLLYQPFTYRKLYNRIERHVRISRGDELKQGPFSLNLHQSVLTTPTGNKKLTPKLAKLMALLMRHPNELVDRRTLMNKVWQTDYMGDTRTLDVHIRWIRQAVEANPNKPVYI